MTVQINKKNSKDIAKILTEKFKKKKIKGIWRNILEN